MNLFYLPFVGKDLNTVLFARFLNKVYWVFQVLLYIGVAVAKWGFDIDEFDPVWLTYIIIFFGVRVLGIALQLVYFIYICVYLCIRRTIVGFRALWSR